jgi:adenine specific DNA methylase Mod
VGSSEIVVTYDQVQKDTSRYQLLTKKGNKEVYRDNQTGQKVTVERQNNRRLTWYSHQGKTVAVAPDPPPVE